MLTVSIVLEAILAATDIIANFLKTDNRFKFDNYLYAYLFFIFLNILFIWYAKKQINVKENKTYNYKTLEKVIVYMLF